LNSPNIQHLQITSQTGAPVQRLKIGPVDVYVAASSGKYPDGNFAVVRGTDSAASLDMPLSCRDLSRDMLGRDLIVLSHVHEDHTAGLDLLPDTPLYVHAGDVDAVRSMDGLVRHYGYAPSVTADACQYAVEHFHYVVRPDAIAYEDQSVWDLGGGVQIRAVHAPGHTTGHSILMMTPGDIAFIGDIDLTGFGPYYGDATSSLAAFRRTLARVRDLPANAWITSHHRGVITDRVVFLTHLEKFCAVLDKRDEALVASLRDKPQSLRDLAERRFVYPRHFNAPFVDGVERRMIAQHLDALQAAGRVRQEGQVWYAT